MEYEGWEIMVEPCNHVVFTHKATATKENMQTLVGNGISYDAAYQHVVILINRQITKLGS